MENLLVATRGGIGDHMIANGIVNLLSAERKIYLACWASWESQLKYLYYDNPNVQLHPHQDKFLGYFHDRNMNKSAQGLNAVYKGICTNDVNMKNYYFDPYLREGLPTEYLYTKFKLPTQEPNISLIEKYRPNKPYAFLNIWDKVAARNLQNFNMSTVDPTLEIVHLTPAGSKNLFDWIPIIEGATEIHSIAGGPFHMIDLVIKHDKMFYHDARLGATFNPNNDYNNKKWNIIRYSDKRAQ
jgi:hypothetical protein